MNIKLTHFMLLLFLIIAPMSVRAQETTPEEESFSGGVVCAPDVYLSEPGDCLPLGPSAFLTSLARLGLTIPLRPLPAYRPDPELTKVPYRYFHMANDLPPKFYPTLADAQAKSENALTYAPGFVYISYQSMDESGHFFLTQSGYWIRGDGNRIHEYSLFQGLLFLETPPNAFGWTFEQIPVKSAPGYGAADTKLVLPSWTVVQVYQTVIVNDTPWNMIGPDQWVEGRKVAVVTPSTTAPEGVTTGRWIDVNLEEQTIAVYENNQLVFATMGATGSKPFWTRPGTFQISEKKEAETMRNNDPSDFYYLENVPFTMYFDGARALHAAYWRTRFGYPQSHGCVNLSMGDAHWLFDWANVGDWVYVHDPSGETPTDPSFYTGGAY
jgi:lipoprotein-anchoring transpeptidase ErfK/SrfK